jgi:3D (Asp-Asp-Asp) domain-containing protein
MWKCAAVTLLLLPMLSGLEPQKEEIQQHKHQASLGKLNFIQAVKAKEVEGDKQHVNKKKTAPKKSDVMTVTVVATGYTAGYESTGKRPNHPDYGITYSGVKVRRDKKTVSTIAADLKLFPLGTIFYIPGYGYGIVADKGSAIKGKKIDLYFNTKKQGDKEWGKKEVDIQLIRKGNGKLTEAMLLELGKVMEVSKEIPEDLWENAI